MQKYQGNSTNAPRETFIGDQRHMLAYINPFEEDLLRNYGGTGQKGPGGVPAFPPRSSRDRAGMSRSTSSSSGATTASSSAAQSQAASNASQGGYGAMSQAAQSNDNDRVGSSAQQASAATRNAAIQSQAATNQAASQAATQAAASRNRAREIALAQPNAQAQSAMNQYGSRANNPQTVSETLMAQQSLRDLASTSTPPIQSMTQTAQLGFAIPGAVTNDAGQQPYSMGSTTVPTSQLSDLELSLEFDEDYQDAKSQLEAAGYVVDEKGIVRTTTGVALGTLSDVVNVGRTTSPPPTSAAGVAAAAPGTVGQVVAPPGAPPGAPPVIKAGPPVNQGIASVGTNYGFDVNQERLDKYKLAGSYDATDTSPEARLFRARAGGMDVAANPRLDKSGKIVTAEDAKYLDIKDRFDGGGPGRAGPSFQTRAQAEAGTYDDKNNFGSSFGITPTGSGRDPTGMAAYIDKGGIFGSLLGGLLGPDTRTEEEKAAAQAKAMELDVGAGLGGGDGTGNNTVSPGTPIVDPCPEGYVLKDGACVLTETDPLGGFPSLAPPLPQGPTVVGNPGYTPAGSGVAPRLNPYLQQMPIMAPPPGLAGAQVGEAGILDLLRAANR
jgi:hypothetical protein